MGDTGATTPIEDGRGGGCPTQLFELLTDIIPLPSNALGESMIVAMEMTLRLPVVLLACGFLKKPFPHAVESRPINLFP